MFGRPLECQSLFQCRTKQLHEELAMQMCQAGNANIKRIAGKVSRIREKINADTEVTDTKHLEYV